MPVKRYRDVADVPPAILGDDDMTATDGLRLACQLSVTALRLAGRSDCPRGVHPHLLGTEAGRNEAAGQGGEHADVSRHGGSAQGL